MSSPTGLATQNTELSVDKHPETSNEITIAPTNESSDGEKASTANAGNDISAPAAPVGASGIPNGGLVAWLQALGSFFLWFNSWYVRDL